MDCVAFERLGFALVPAALTAAEVEELLRACAPVAADLSAGHRAGIRNLLREVPAVAKTAASPAVRKLVCPVLGPEAFPVRALFFDKTPETNWKVPWHQDLALAVAERREVPGFAGWSLKEGVPHVHAPAEVLAQMLTVRLHLDDCGTDNGPLRVLPGSHASGKLDAAALTTWRAQVEELECLLPSGGALVMRPLLLHASSPARQPGHRRVLHLEFANQPLPGGLRWAFAGASPS